MDAVRQAGVRHGPRASPAACWPWLIPVVCALAVFAAVLATTPPGFRALTDVAFTLPRGANAEAAAYALGAASSLGLLTLVGVAVVCGAIAILLRRRMHA